MSNRKKICIAVAIAAVLWALIVFSNSMRAGVESTQQSLGVLAILIRWFPALRKVDHDIIHGTIRKLAHLTEYTILGVLLARAFACKRDCKLALFAAPLLTGVVLAAIDETIQRFTPGRNGMIGDVLLDAIGVVCGILIYRLWRKRHKKEEGV